MPKGDRVIGKADPEDGTTPVANLLLEALAMAHLSGEEKGAVLYLWRQTYGWVDGNRRKVWDEISLTEWATALNTNRRYALKILAGLVEKRVLIRKDLGKGRGYLYTTNTRVAQWDRSCLGEQGVSILTTVVVSKQTTQGVSERTPGEVPKQATVPVTNPRLLKKDKENIKENNSSSKEILVTPDEIAEIATLYQEEIGQITSMVGAALNDAVQQYPANNIKDAIKEAALRNKRSWKYIEAILENWKAKGRGSGGNGPDKYAKQKYGNMVRR